jgi:hypothetical protein
MAFLGLLSTSYHWSKIKMFNSELDEKSYQHSPIEFDGESDGGGPEDKKPFLDPLYDSN